MSALNKLAIRGIRSFDDKQISVIEFFSPVTVIVGHNGSGKTTIIECLKYATTGDQPPNTRGGAFVHDPKMANEKEVKAQVKLRFKSANGTLMLAVRNLSVTVKKTGLTMKTLESILALADGNDKGGKRNAISTKCAEMDQEIPQLLGVSKAVLENVIFCHQEDSYWPLAEASTLKKKFDDIFEATKYTKALDSIKSLRKERVAELKAEKERLEGLAREKSHSDKLRGRINNLKDEIAQKEANYQDTKDKYDELVRANAKFLESATSFKTIYIQLEAIEKNIERLQEDLDGAKSSIQEMPDSDEELQAKLNNSDQDVQAQHQKLQMQRGKASDLVHGLDRSRQQQTQLATDLGTFKAEHAAQQQRLKDREQIIHSTSDKYKIKGFSHVGLDAEHIIQFTAKLSDLYEKQKKAVSALQTESISQTEAYTSKLSELNRNLEMHKAQRQSLQTQLSKAQTSIKQSERELESMSDVSNDVASMHGEIEDKKGRLGKAKADIAAAEYDKKVQDKNSTIRDLEETREMLGSEFKALTLQADARVKLKMQQDDVQSKSTEIGNTIDAASKNFRRLVGVDPDPQTIDREVERVLIEKNSELGDVESEATGANNQLQQERSTLNNLKQQLKAKKDELKAIERKVVNGLDNPSKDIDEQIEEARGELAYRITTSNASKYGTQTWESILSEGKRRKVCTACNRHLDAHEIPNFEKHLKDQIRRCNADTVGDLQAEVVEWETVVKELQDMKPHVMHRDRLRTTEVPSLEAQIKELDAKLPVTTNNHNHLVEQVEDIKRSIGDLQALKTQAQTISRLQQEIKRANENIAAYEDQLSVTGSVKTADDIQAELDEVTSNIRKHEKQKEAIQKEKETRTASMRLLEGQVNKMEVDVVRLEGKLREKQALEAQIEQLKKDVQTCIASSKLEDAAILKAKEPIDALRTEHEKTQRSLDKQITDAQTLYQELRSSVEHLSQTNKGIENYVRGRREQRWKEAEERAIELKDDIADQESKLAVVREAISKIEKEISSRGAMEAIIRENQRVRKMAKDIELERRKKSELDLEGAARAKRQFTEKFGPSKEKETELHSLYSQLAGELTSQNTQLKSLEADLKDFKNINKQYTDQLIKVKMSDMANNDLEKYAKALDNAIMKYHSLKMDEVNETMKHLWNKTYQGTDIDGIRIASDVEGGASKRSYNYRARPLLYATTRFNPPLQVVMTKDQVEMDMRGRCSAGQKMLASIIIRLALSDSFGQNCGILALDEPTNALDTENIEALASSLVDIIKERKHHSNFQLIIITHDENFLRKLGQSDVMEYYWRVSRDARQKSVIERQRFR
ncbi:AAA-23 domain-containing protein [Mycena chlorophos]|uniref:DNA repair protein RAD50 n=1 Tax=Mycena chlorophos TaxID=658473 RepID=A0A8H6RWE2_MYCCL|nr:AAA-23 domain-containing protein [Mycena chlorophos]